jgi:hypothetical protein
MCLTCGWTLMRRRVRVEIFFKIAALDISTPLALALDGDSTIFSTTVTVDFSPEVGRHVTHHRCMMPHRLASIWPDGRSVLDRRRTSYGRRMCRWRGVRILCRCLAPPLMERCVDGSDDELIDVATPLLYRRGRRPRWRRVVEQLACRRQCRVDTRYHRWCGHGTSGALGLTFYHDRGSTRATASASQSSRPGAGSSPPLHLPLMA